MVNETKKPIHTDSIGTLTTQLWEKRPANAKWNMFVKTGLTHNIWQACV